MKTRGPSEHRALGPHNFKKRGSGWVSGLGGGGGGGGANEFEARV